MLNSNEPILGVVTRDCARFLKIEYHFSNILSLEDLRRLRLPNESLHEFSKYCKGAQDHVKFVSIEPSIVLNAVIHSKNFVVTFGRFSFRSDVDARTKQLVEEFEQNILRLQWGSHVVKTVRADVYVV